MDKRKSTIIKKEETISGRKNDKIQVTSFSVKPLNPKTGETVTVKMSVKNVSGTLLQGIPWQIVCDKNVLESGIRRTLPKGDSFTVSVTWTAKPGGHFFHGDVDPENVLNEPKVKQYNNFPQGIDIVVSK
jgi:hypothetical protein